MLGVYAHRASPVVIPKIYQLLSEYLLRVFLY